MPGMVSVSYIAWTYRAPVSCSVASHTQAIPNPTAHASYELRKVSGGDFSKASVRVSIRMLDKLSYFV